MVMNSSEFDLKERKDLTEFMFDLIQCLIKK